MAAFKVSLAFLEGPVHTVISKSEYIAKCMDQNTNFPSPPITAGGVKTAVDHLKEMEAKTHKGGRKDLQNRDIALADLDDFIRQNAKYINRLAYYDNDKLLSSGYDSTPQNEIKRAEPIDRGPAF
jgi:hypothetical protein